MPTTAPRKVTWERNVATPGSASLPARAASGERDWALTVRAGLGPRVC
jgi:hypothetical protein